MIRSMIAAAVIAAATLTGPAVAADAAGPPTELTLSYMAEAGYATAVVLRCDPAGGAHPTPARACRTLRKAGGRPGRLEPARTMCTLIYAPITAQITGTWRGRPLRWSQRYGNSCEMTRATGVLFTF